MVAVLVGKGETEHTENQGVEDINGRPSTSLPRGLAHTAVFRAVSLPPSLVFHCILLFCVHAGTHACARVCTGTYSEARGQ